MADNNLKAIVKAKTLFEHWKKRVLKNLKFARYGKTVKEIREFIEEKYEKKIPIEKMNFESFEKFLDAFDEDDLEVRKRMIDGKCFVFSKSPVNLAETSTEQGLPNNQWMPEKPIILNTFVVPNSSLFGRIMIIKPPTPVTPPTPPRSKIVKPPTTVATPPPPRSKISISKKFKIKN